jgi:hypothetical protein
MSGLFSAAYLGVRILTACRSDCHRGLGNNVRVGRVGLDTSRRTVGFCVVCRSHYKRVDVSDCVACRPYVTMTYLWSSCDD